MGNNRNMAIIVTFTGMDDTIYRVKNKTLTSLKWVPAILESQLISPDSFIGKTFIQEMGIKNRASENKELVRNMGPIKMEINRNGYCITNSIYNLARFKTGLLNMFTRKLVIEFVPN